MTNTSYSIRNQAAPLTFFQLRLGLALFSLLLSAFAYFNDDIINSDGILYMQMAEAYLQGGLAATASLYDWPFFSILIALLGNITGLSLETSAMLLNSVLFVLFTDALLLISSRLLATQQHLLIAAVLILFFYSINDYRDFIIRDIGYWAFISMALWQFINFIDGRRLYHALGWQLLAGIALLFRIEAAMMLMLLPLFMLAVRPWKEAFRSVIQLYSIVLLTTLLLAIVVMINAGNGTEAFGKISSILQYLDLVAYLERFDQHSSIIAKHILHHVADDQAGIMLFSGMTGILLYQLITGLSAPYLILLLLSLKQQTNLFNSSASRLLGYFLLVNFLILLFFGFKLYFVSSRYCIMAVAALFLILLPRLCELIDVAITQRYKGKLTLITLLLVYAMGDVVYQSSSKAYIPEASLWAAQHLPAGKRVMTDSEFVAYYFNKSAHRADLDLTRNLRGAHLADYLIIVEKDQEKRPHDLLQNLPLEKLHQTENRRGDRAFVYRLNQAG